MRPTCKSHTNDKVAKGECCGRKRAAGNPGGKPTNVATFTKRKKQWVVVIWDQQLIQIMAE